MVQQEEGVRTGFYSRRKGGRLPAEPPQAGAGPGEGRGEEEQSPGWWTQPKDLDPPPARKQNCAVDSRGRMKGKWDLRRALDVRERS